MWMSVGLVQRGPCEGRLALRADDRHRAGGRCIWNPPVIRKQPEPHFSSIR